MLLINAENLQALLVAMVELAEENYSRLENIYLEKEEKELNEKDFEKIKRKIFDFS